MRRKPGGRGYWADPTDKKGKNSNSKGKESGAAEKVEVEVGAKTEGGKEKEDIVQQGGSVKHERPGWDEAKLYGGTGEAVGEIRRPERAVTMRERAASFESNKFTKEGVGSIWSDKVADRFKGGYDGRKVRRRAWEDDVDRSEGVGRK